MNRKQRRKDAAGKRKTERLQDWADRTGFDPNDRSQRVSKHASVMIADDHPWTPFENMGPSRDGSTTWRNSRYQVAVYPPRASMMEGWPPIIHLSFKRRDNIAITDFRDFQRIKNELVSTEAEAVQIFPPEHQLVDTANQYHLWVMAPMPGDPDKEWPHMPFGFRDSRLVSDGVSEAGHGRQRAFDDGERPDDCLSERDLFRRLYDLDSPETIEKMIDTGREGGAEGVANQMEQWRAEFDAEAKYRIYFDDVDAENDGHGWNVVTADDDEGGFADRFKEYKEAIEWIYAQEGVAMEAS